MIEYKLPELGENITTGSIVSIFVKVGDAVKKDQDLLELETDKASLPIPSPTSGTIKEILVKEGTDITIGTVMFKIEEIASEAPASAPEQKPAEPKAEASAPAPKQEPTQQTQTTQPTTNPDQKIVVVGGGPGGYAAAFLAADMGLNVTLVNKEENPGGVCLYRGCIPSKALLHAAKILSESREAKEIGIEFAKPTIHLDQLRTWKEKVVNQMTGGLGVLSKQRKINYIQGEATFKDSQNLIIKKSDGSEELFAFDKAILATGSTPIMLPNLPQSDRIMDSTGALELKDIPKSLLVVGGGYIGLELGTVYAEIGSEVSVVEMTSSLLPGADRDLAKILEKRAKTIFKTIMLNTKVIEMKEGPTGILVSFEDQDGKTTSQEFEKVLVAIGRKPNSKNCGIENTKVQLDEKGFTKINAQRCTDDPSIYAIGDIAGEPMLAHKASHEGRVAVESIAGHKVAFEPNAIPAVVFTDPEIAWCGLTETQAKAEGKTVEVAKFPWAASGRAVTLNRTDGLTKLIIDPESERVLGVAIVGPGAGEMISEGVLAIEMGTVASDIKLTIHPHPTISETIMEAAESFFGQSTHIYRPKKGK